MTAEVRTRRSDTTRAAILTAARERFARDGYERATIRAIAADAGIDPAMVMRYYGSKDRLFAVAAEYDLRIPDFSGVPDDRIGMEVVRHFVDRWDGDESLVALLRAAVSNDAAVEKMREIFGTQLIPLIAGRVTDQAEVPDRAGMVATQMLGLALCRYVLKLPPVAAMTVDDLTEWIGPTLRRYLG